MNVLTLALIAVYALGASFAIGGFVMDEMSFKNPEYGKAVLGGLLWPLLIVQIVVAKAFGLYFGDIYRGLKEGESLRVAACTHEDTTSVDEGDAYRKCKDCGKTWG